MTVSIPIAINDPAGIARIRQPITMGLPFPRGVIRDPSRLSLHRSDGAAEPLQASVLHCWPDGSIKWALLDFQVDVAAGASTQRVLHIDDRRASPSPDNQVDVAESHSQFLISTGPATFTLGKHLLDPGLDAAVGGVKVTEPSRSRCALVDSEGQVYLPSIRTVSIETRGPLRTTFRVDGAFSHRGETLADFVARLTFFADSAAVRLALTVRNPRPARHAGNFWDLGDPGSIYIRDLSLQIALSPAGLHRTIWSTEVGSPFVETLEQSLEIYQDSSGGPNWAGANHVSRRGEVTTSFCGYRLRAPGTEASGLRAQPLVALCAGASGVVGTVSRFWQDFPKAIEVDGDRLTIRLFPHQSKDVHELQGGEQKTHVIHLGFIGAPADAVTMDWLRGDVVAHASAEWYATSSAVPYLTPRSADRYEDHLRLVDQAIEGDSAFDKKREIADEYGWRHFGDLYADHEAIHYHGLPPVISHYNNQYDALDGALIQFLRSADLRWHSILDPLAAHVVDIDIYHAVEDRPEYAGGLFWHTNHYSSAATATHRSYSRRSSAHGGGPSSGHCYTTGLMHHYFLTGEERSREAVIGLADWILAMEDGARSRLRWVDRGPTGCASATHTPSYHGPGRGPANAVNTLLDAHLLTENRSYLEAADGLVRRCIHPYDDLPARRLEEAEVRWSYSMFLQMLGRYLDLKIERSELDFMYSYGRESLLAYARWMVDHEVPYLSRPERLEFPTETWSAQDMRKSDVFKFAAKHASGRERERFLERSEYFFASSIAGLTAAKTRDLTRPVVIMMTCGYMHAYFDLHPEETAPAGPRIADFGVPRPFIPQRERVLRRAKALGAGLVAGLAAAGAWWVAA